METVPGTMWAHMFTLGVPVAEKMLRPALIYVFLVVCLRVFGKRELAQLNPFDLVVLLSLSNTVQNAIIGDDNSLVGGMVGALALLVINYTVVRFFFRHRRLDQVFEGMPTTLIADGQVIPAALARELLTESELLMVAHRQGFAGFEEIERCVLEPGGTFSIQGRQPREVLMLHQEVIRRLDAVQRQVADLSARVADVVTTKTSA